MSISSLRIELHLTLAFTIAKVAAIRRIAAGRCVVLT
jgi:hypothetical protein